MCADLVLTRQVVGCAQTERIGVIKRIITSERVRIARSRRFSDQKRITTSEPADHWVVETGSEMREAEPASCFSPIPLLSREGRIACDRAQRGRFAVRREVQILDEGSIL